MPVRTCSCVGCTSANWDSNNTQLVQAQPTHEQTAASFAPPHYLHAHRPRSPTQTCQNVCVCVVCTPIQSLNLIEGVPPMEEFQRFQACGAAAEDHGRGGGGAGLGHTGDLSSLVAALPTGTSAPKSVFVKGDLVVLVKGTWGGGHTRRRTDAHRGLAHCQRSRRLHTGRQAMSNPQKQV